MTDNRYDPIRELNKVVDILTKEHEELIDQKGSILGMRREQPLLLKLRLAVASNMGGAGAGKAGRERVPINVGAADLQDRILADIREWYGRETDYAEHGRTSPESTLRQWFIRYVNRYRAGQVSDDGFDRQTAVVAGWVTQIRDLLDPPFRWTLTSPCPICGHEWVEAFAADDPNEIERVRVLNAVERESIEDSYVICRNSACGRIWRGVFEARALRILIDDAELMRDTPMVAGMTTT